MESKAMHEFPAPSGCRECCLSETVLTEKGFALKCKSADTLAYEEDNGRHPDCPLKIVPETPEGELKPCPFCGEPKTGGVTEIIPGYPDESTPRYEIVCWKCFGRVPDYGSGAEAIAAWNRRA